MEDDAAGSARRVSSRTRRVATKMAAALASSDNREQAALARLEALESDFVGAETMEISSDEDGSLDGDDQAYIQRKQSKNMKRKTRHGKAMENAKRAPRTFMELLHDANLEALPHHVPTYLRAAVGPPTATARRHFCTVCGYTASYTCVRCGARFCSCRCQVIHGISRVLEGHQDTSLVGDQQRKEYVACLLQHRKLLLGFPFLFLHTLTSPSFTYHLIPPSLSLNTFFQINPSSSPSSTYPLSSLLHQFPHLIRSNSSNFTLRFYSFHFTHQHSLMPIKSNISIYPSSHTFLYLPSHHSWSCRSTSIKAIQHLDIQAIGSHLSGRNTWSNGSHRLKMMQGKPSQ